MHVVTDLIKNLMTLFQNQMHAFVYSAAVMGATGMDGAKGWIFPLTLNVNFAFELCFKLV